MRLTHAIKPISYLKANTARLIEEINTSGDPIIITQNGEGKAVLMSL